MEENQEPGLAGTEPVGAALPPPDATLPKPWTLRCNMPLLALLGVYCLLWVPLIPRSTDNPQLLAAFINDEPLMTMQLVGMRFSPYGNPSTFLKNPERRPAEWGFISYPGIMYYGGTYPGLGFLIYGPCLLLGLPDFPTAPIILRSISALSGLASLLLVYLLARRLGGPWAGFGAGLLLLCDKHFSYYCSIMHPDTTMLALGLLALWTAIRHAESGTWRSLLGLGALAGVIHGTKMGGPWVMPMALTALLWGCSVAGIFKEPRRLLGLHVVGRLASLGLVAAVSFIGTTPYAVLDSYYFRIVRQGWALFRDSPWTRSNLGDWLLALWDHLGVILAFMALAALAAVALSAFRRDKPKALILTTILGLSVIGWYSVTVKLWIILGYMLVGLAVVYVLIGLVFAFGVTSLQRQGSWGRLLASALSVSCVLAVLHFRGVSVASMVLYEHARSHFTGVTVGRWAEQNLPHQSKILFDDVAYFDPAVFPNAQLYGGLMTYAALEKYKPDYFVLSENIYGCAHYREMRRTQKDVRGKESPFSVLLYQDVLDRDGFPEAELVHTFSPTIAVTSSRFESLWTLLRMAVGADESLFGCEFKLYRLRPAASSSGSAAQGDAVPASD